MVKKKVTREAIVAEARTWLNTPFHHQGRVKSVGVDCAGVIIGTADTLRLLSDFEDKPYAKSPSADQLRTTLKNYMIEIAVNEAKSGDVLLFAFDREPQHVAFLTDIGILHAYAQVRKCVEHSFDAVWKSRVRGAYRFKGII